MINTSSISPINEGLWSSAIIRWLWSSVIICLLSAMKKDDSNHTFFWVLPLYNQNGPSFSAAVPFWYFSFRFFFSSGFSCECQVLWLLSWHIPRISHGFNYLLLFCNLNENFINAWQWVNNNNNNKLKLTTSADFEFISDPSY